MNKNTIDFENMENISNDFIFEYNKMIESGIPSLWDKIEKGYNKEFASMKKDGSLNDSDGSEKHNEEKIIDIKSKTTKKNKRTFKILTSVAAVLLVFLISAPIFLALTIKKSSDVKTMDSEKWIGIAEADMAEENMEEMAEADMIEADMAEAEMAEADMTEEEMKESVNTADATIMPQESETVHENTINEGEAASYDMVYYLFDVGYEIKMNNDK